MILVYQILLLSSPTGISLIREKAIFSKFKNVCACRVIGAMAL